MDSVAIGSKAGRRARLTAGIAATSLILASLWLVWNESRKNHFLPCRMDCEETFVALHQAQNLRLLHSGVRLLEDRATGSNPAAHPSFSTSAPNIASLVFESLEWMGARELETKQFATLMIFGLGLLYAYRAVSLNAGSEVLGAIFILLLATTDLQVLGFGQNALRAWHFLVFFGLLFHAGRVAQNPAKPLRRDYVAVTALLLIAFGIGYDFQAICFFSSTFLFWLNSRNLVQRRRLKFIGYLFSAFLIPIIFWQIYVAAVAGVDFWREALDGATRVASFLNIRTAQLLAQTVRDVSIPTMGALSWLLFALVGGWAMWRTTQEFLSAHFTAQIKGLVNAALAGAGIIIGAKLFGDAVGLQAPIYIRVVVFLAVAAAVLVWWWLFRYAVAAAVTEASAWKISGLPGIRWGLLLIVPVFLLFAMTVSAQRNAVTPEGSPFWPRVRWLYLTSLGLAVITGAIALMPKLQRVILPAGRIHTWFSALATRVKSARATGAFLNPRARSTLCSMILGIGAACILFGPVAVFRYFQLQFPLVIFPILLAKSLAILWLLAQASAYYRPARPVALATALILAALLADHAIVQWTNFRQEAAMDISWLEFVRSHPDSTYAVSWTPQAVAAFTTGWTVGIQPGRENRIADRIHSGEAPFASDDLSQFGQRDAPDDPGRYLRPDYWIYFPTDRIHTAEGLEPFCRQDYLVDAWQKMTASRDRPVVQVLTIRPEVTRPGSEVLIDALVTVRPDLFDRLEVLQPDAVARPYQGSSLLEIEREAHENSVIGQLRYDCASRIVRGRIRVSGDLIPAQDHQIHFLQFPLQVRYKDGRRFITGAAALTIGNDVKEQAIPEREPEPQPSAASLASALSQLPRAADGARYVIFDLRPMYHGNPP